MKDVQAHSIQWPSYRFLTTSKHKSWALETLELPEHMAAVHQRSWVNSLSGKSNKKKDLSPKKKHSFSPFQLMINASPDPQPPPPARPFPGRQPEWRVTVISCLHFLRCQAQMLVACAHQRPRWLPPPLLTQAFSTWLIAACWDGARGEGRCWGVGGNHKISGDCIWCCQIAGSLISSWYHVIELLLWRSVPLAVH